MAKFWTLGALSVAAAAAIAGEPPATQPAFDPSAIGSLRSIERRFGQPDLQPFRLAKPSATQSGPAPHFAAPQPIVQGFPLIQTKGIVRDEHDVLYIADTGRDPSHTEPATIWRFDTAKNELSVFYRGSLLVNAKWLFYRASTAGHLAELYVSDYGEEPNPREPGTGKGAKVFSIPIDEHGRALTPRVLHAGPPLRSPEGITVIGDSVILADWAAGEKTTLPGRPGTFNRGLIFRIPTEGGEPSPLFPDQLFVTLIGSCRYEDEDGNSYIRFIDIDGGRPHKENAYLPQSGLVAFFRTRILSEEPLVLGRLERVQLREIVELDIPIERNLSSDEALEIELHDGARFPDGSTTAQFAHSVFPSTGAALRLTIESDSAQADVRLTASVTRNTLAPDRTTIVRRKPFAPSLMADNKHGGRVTPNASTNVPRLTATADGTSRGLYMVPPNGGTPATVWRGEPFVQPMGVQYSVDGRKVWLTDQAGGQAGTSAIFEVQLPTFEERRAAFIELRQQQTLKTVPGQ